MYHFSHFLNVHPLRFSGSLPATPLEMEKWLKNLHYSQEFEYHPGEK